MCSWPGGVLEAITHWLGYSKARQLICECRRKPAVCDRGVSKACREYWLKPKSRLSFGSEEIICATELLAFSTNKAHRSPFLAMNLVCSLKKPVHRSLQKWLFLSFLATEIHPFQWIHWKLSQHDTRFAHWSKASLWVLYTDQDDPHRTETI